MPEHSATELNFHAFQLSIERRGSSDMSTKTAATLLDGFQPAPTRSFCARETFVAALSCERKRCERSGNSLLLALLHLDRVQGLERTKLEGVIVSSLCAAIRDTDIPGWYKEKITAGVIYTDLTDASRVSSQATIHARIMEALGAVLPAEIIAQLTITYHFYPERDGTPVSPADPALYVEPSRPADSAKYRLGKRCIDIAASLFGLLLTAPLSIMIAILIKLTSAGPVFFKQARVGQGGRQFVFLKFRSMYVNNDNSVHKEYVARMIAGQKVAHDDGTETGLYKILNDRRVTRIGAILRRSSLDELPQLINVLKGDMSLIGPRPPLPYEVEQYSPWHRRRVIEVKPGITGLWQVSGRSRTSFDEMVRLDLQYILRWSIWLDLKILLRTPRAVISGNGAC
jgi:lipopolysaccharide/colanic/teichoic acid biosynthesis glycosyltransferase